MQPATALIVHPALTDARAGLARARSSLASALEAWDELRTGRLPAVAHRFAATLGDLTLVLLEAELRCARARRTLEACRAARARGAAPDLAAIRADLDARLAQFTAQVEQARAQQLHDAAVRLVETPAVEARELRTMYRALVKRLHPDVCGGAVDPRWHLVTLAYESLDLDALRALADEVSATPPPEPLAVGAGFDARLAALREETARLERRRDAVRARIATTCTTPPYSLRDLLEDPSWVQAERDALCARIDAQRALAEAFEAEAASHLEKEEPPDDRPRTN